MFRVTIAQAHRDRYGLAYPCTYEFSLPAGSSGLTVQKRVPGSGWVPLTARTASAAYTGMEGVRFDYAANRAWVSASFDHLTSANTFDLRFRLGGAEATGIAFVGKANYFDNRAFGVVMTWDDWNTTHHASFLAMAAACRARGIWSSPGIITGTATNADPQQPGPTASVWADIQGEIDAGHVDVYNHSVNHLVAETQITSPSIATAQIDGASTAIKANLTLPWMNRMGADQFVLGYCAPYGDWNGLTRARMQHAGLICERGYNDDFNPRANSWAAYDTTLNTFTRVGSAVLIDDEPVKMPWLNLRFEEWKNAGGIYHAAGHPWAGWDWGNPASDIYQHLDHIGGHDDCWYVGWGHLYAYRLVALEAAVTVETDDGGPELVHDSGRTTSDLTSHTTPVLPPGNYYVEVQYEDQPGAWSAWSAGEPFVVEASDPIELAAAGGALQGGTAGLIAEKFGAASGGVFQGGSATLDAGKTLAATAGATQGGSPSLATAKPLAVQAGALHGGTADLLALSSLLSAKGGVYEGGTASLSVAKPLAATEGVEYGGNADVQAAKLPAATGGDIHGGSGALAATRLLAVDGGAVHGGAPSLRATKLPSAAGGALHGGAALLDAPRQLRAASGAEHGGSATLSVSRPLAVAGGSLHGGTASLAVDSSLLSARGGANADGTASLRTDKPLAATSGVEYGGEAGLAVPKRVAATGGALHGGAAAISATRLLSAAAGAIHGGSATAQVGVGIELAAEGGASAGGSASLRTAKPLSTGGGASHGGTGTLYVVRLLAAHAGALHGAAASLELVRLLEASGGVLYGGSAALLLGERPDLLPTTRLRGLRLGTARLTGTLERDRLAGSLTTTAILKGQV